MPETPEPTMNPTQAPETPEPTAGPPDFTPTFTPRRDLEEESYDGLKEQPQRDEKEPCELCPDAAVPGALEKMVQSVNGQELNCLELSMLYEMFKKGSECQTLEEELMYANGFKPAVHCECPGVIHEQKQEKLGNEVNDW